MGGIRAAFSRSAADRDLHTYLSRAGAAVRSAMDVCGRAARGQSRVIESHYRQRQRRLAQALRLLQGIGHLEDVVSTVDLADEARALCAWLESRERAGGVQRHSRRGREYQDRLTKVSEFLRALGAPEDEDEPAKPEIPEVPVEQVSMGTLWDRAVTIAKQHGEGDNDAYVTAIFQKLAGGGD